jgi:hypothetical protein
MATYLNNLGLVLHDLDDLAAAKANFVRALKICEVVYGPENVNTAGIMNNFGVLLLDMGEHENAVVVVQKALEISRATLGDDHPNTKLAMANLEAIKERR